MATSTLTKRIEFSASHFYRNPAWDEEKNRQVFGSCYEDHGHNYLLEVTLGGRVDPVTGMIINLYDLKHIVTDVLEEFDHKQLNLDTPYFEHVIPTTEALALVLWKKFRDRPETKDIYSLRLFESEDLWAEILTPHSPDPSVLSDYQEPSAARLTKRYEIVIPSSVQAIDTLGAHLILDVTVEGPIHSSTGRVTDILKLDQLIQQHLFTHLHGKAPSLVGAFQSKPLTLFTLAEYLWPFLQPVSGGQLVTLTLQNERKIRVDYQGANIPACSKN